MTISTKLLCSGYNKNQILYDVDFKADNELTVITGSNGSGKSTLLKSILGLCDVYSGDIMLDEQNITNIPTHKIRDLGIAYMSQRENVFSELNVLENLTIAHNSKNLDLEYIFDLFPILGEYKRKKGKNLSGGERQLLAMAMTIIRKPEVILFDEPTANLSPKNSSMILGKIKEIQSELNNCVILVEQNVKNSLKISDKCYLFSNGKIIYDGNADKLLADSELAEKFLGINK